MCHVALDRAARIAERLDLPGDIAGWHAAANRLRALVLDRAWNEDAQALSEHIDGDGRLDASLLALPLRRVIPPTTHAWWPRRTRSLTGCPRVTG
jgi:GH15 family glucan-1,4-alpha-glucosidase